jgi:poly(3-hydroxybutyrate) depolymerase
VQLSSWTCAGEQSVTLAVITGLGHDWPGSRQPGAVRWLARPPAPAPLDATTFLWQHLRTSTLS